ncbi:MAG: alanine--tRNA ligase [Candidatus Dojkabacteria bacterium]|nr:MAG: alanine--tRNA ligase [Candidatus Dojkabacteria bacterium]
MKYLTYLEVRNAYLNFLKSNGHKEVPNASLVPENDPTLLFVNSGMFPLVPFLLGEDHPLGTRLVNVQRCVRTEDLEEVGDASHATAFEMIGNWSLGDYFKEQALTQTYEFFVEKLEIPIERLYATVFEGDSDAALDTESIDILKKIFTTYGIDAKVGKGERIQLYGKSKNWWGLPGGGPCGTTSEIFYDTGKDACGKDCHVNCDCGKYIEIGNNVFMEFLNKEGTFTPLARKNVDFGGGLDRIVILLQQVESYHDTDIYKPIGDGAQALATRPNQKSIRVIIDHVKTATWMIMDGVEPGKTEKEYVLRRIIRRAIRHGMQMGIEKPFMRELGKIAITQFSPIYPQLTEQEEHILSVMEQEEKKFRNTLRTGISQVSKIANTYANKTFTNDNGESFFVYESYGFPPEMFLEELQTLGVAVDTTLFWNNHALKVKDHQEKSRTATQGLFAGGLADTSEKSTHYHTTTHLLLAALRKLIGEHIYQKGSNITPERLRFDFPNPDKLSPEQISAVEQLVNEQIAAALPVSYTEMEREKALVLVPFAAFEGKYASIVKVYRIGEGDTLFSQELCNGPHVKNTGDIKGTFKITKQEKIGNGILRVKGVLE